MCARKNVGCGCVVCITMSHFCQFKHIRYINYIYLLCSGSIIVVITKRVVWYFEEGGVVLWRGWSGTLKRVVRYFEEGGVVLWRGLYIYCFMQRKHHCRNCGQTYCGDCSLKMCPIPAYAIIEEVRVCDKCFNSLTKGSSVAKTYGFLKKI